MNAVQSPCCVSVTHRAEERLVFAFLEPFCPLDSARARTPDAVRHERTFRRLGVVACRLLMKCPAPLVLA